MFEVTPWFLALLAKWQVRNEDTAKYFGIAMGGLMCVFIFTHWIDVVINKYSTKQSAIKSIYKAIVHSLQRLNKPFTIFSTTFLPGQVTLVLVYLGINAGLTFYDHPEKAGQPTIHAKRYGWLALCNLTLTIFLGLKNTPLSPLAGRSCDSLNILHRCTGYTTILYMTMHGIAYLIGLHIVDAWFVTALPRQYAGYIAGASMLAILVTAIGPIRKKFYEVFYATHVVLTATILVALGLHRPLVATHSLIITSIAAALWVLDSTLRISRWFYYGIGNHCTLTPLPSGATRVTLHRPIRAQPGSSAFLWIPAIKMFQRHPFTLHSTSPSASFIIKSRDGFTKALHARACTSPPETKFRVAIEGPYGKVPNTHDFDHVILLAGGSGITFTLSLALDWARKRRTPKDNHTLHFIWAVRHKETLEWISPELRELRSNPRVRVSLHVTGGGDASNRSSGDDTEEKSSGSGHASQRSFGAAAMEESGKDLEKKISLQVRPAISSRNSDDSLSMDVVVSGRPEVGFVVNGPVRGMAREERVLVAGCGPRGFLDCVRSAVRENSIGNGPGVEMYLEQFSF